MSFLICDNGLKGRNGDMMSHPVQNEILYMYCHSVVDKICKLISDAGSFAVIVEGTQDISRKEQMSICIHDEEFVNLMVSCTVTG